MNLPIEYTVLIIIGCILILYIIIYYLTRKKILLNYKSETFTALGATVDTYILLLKVTALWGLHEELIEEKYDVPIYSHNRQAYLDHWDNLIKTEKPL